MDYVKQIYPNVALGENSEVGLWVIIGEPPQHKQPGELTTVIGSNANIRSHTVIYAGNVIGTHFNTGHGVLVRELNTIGDDVSIGSHSVIEHHVVLGNKVRIHSQVFIPEFSILEDEAWVGPNVVFTNALHPRCPQVKNCLKGATIRRGAKIGANATLAPDVVIGEMALVGAGSVVTDDVPAGVVVAGNPARIIKNIDALNCPYDLIESPYGNGEQLAELMLRRVQTTRKGRISS